MLIKIDDTYHKIHRDGNNLWIDLHGSQAVSADSLSNLIHKLETFSKSVSLPQNIFTTDLAILDELLELGFDRLEQTVLIFPGKSAILKPYGYWFSKARKADPSADRKHFRLYLAEWTDDEGNQWSQIFTEAELQELE